MRKVMIADDEKRVRTALKMLIPWKELQCEVVYEAENGAQVLEHLEDSQADILILDIQMPMVTGLEVAKQASERGYDIEIILLTAFAEFEYARKAVQYDVREYIIKTAVLEELPEALRRVCARLDKKARSITLREKQECLRTLMMGTDRINTDQKLMKRVLKEYNQPGNQFRLVMIQGAAHNVMGCLDQVFSQWIHIAFALNQQKCCVLLTGKTLPKQELADICANLGALVGGAGDNAGFFYISGIFESVFELPKAYDACCSLAEKNFQADTENVLFADDVAQKQSLPGNIYAKLMMLIQAMDQRQEEKILQTESELLRECKSVKLQTARSVGLLLLTECVQIVLRANPEMPEMFTDVALQEQIYACQSYKEFCLLITLIVEQTMSIIQRQQEQTDLVVQQADKYIAANYCTGIKLADIADAIHINRNYLSRVYKEKTGQNIFDVINKKRLEFSKELLVQQNMKVSDVAERLGFKDTAYFSRFFKRYMKMSPKEYQISAGREGKGQ